MKISVHQYNIPITHITWLNFMNTSILSKHWHEFNVWSKSRHFLSVLECVRLCVCLQERWMCIVSTKINMSVIWCISNEYIHWKRLVICNINMCAGLKSIQLSSSQVSLTRNVHHYTRWALMPSVSAQCSHFLHTHTRQTYWIITENVTFDRWPLPLNKFWI